MAHTKLHASHQTTAKSLLSSSGGEISFSLVIMVMPGLGFCFDIMASKHWSWTIATTKRPSNIVKREEKVCWRIKYIDNKAVFPLRDLDGS